MFCTEAPEVHQAIDRAHLVVDGRLSQAIVVGDYAHIEAFAALIARMQRHSGEPVHDPDLSVAVEAGGRASSKYLLGRLAGNARKASPSLLKVRLGYS
jgi:hypothetical protein